MKVQTIRFVSIKDILVTDEALETFASIVTNEYSWGDTLHAMVTQHSLLRTLKSDEEFGKSQGDLEDEQACALVRDKIRDALDALNDDSILIDLY